jgi:hypothetical protein
MGKVQLTGGRTIFNKFSNQRESISALYSGNSNFTPSSADLTETF